MSIAGLVKALQALNQTSWQDAFLGLWIAALRLVQRVRAHAKRINEKLVFQI